MPVVTAVTNIISKLNTAACSLATRTTLAQCGQRNGAAGRCVGRTAGGGDGVATRFPTRLQTKACIKFTGDRAGAPERIFPVARNEAAERLVVTQGRAGLRVEMHGRIPAAGDAAEIARNGDVAADAGLD